jgi:hypothetical protein
MISSASLGGVLDLFALPDDGDRLFAQTADARAARANAEARRNGKTAGKPSRVSHRKRLGESRTRTKDRARKEVISSRRNNGDCRLTESAR